MTAEAFCLRLTKDCAVCPGGHVLAAVSGGADSVALLCFLCEVRDRLGLTVSCAHVEHGIRGETSLGDMAFVRTLCMQKNIPFFVRQVDVPGYAARHGCGIEEAARTLRHRALRQMAEEAGADVIALAHHALDQAETVLMRAARGSDVRGLCAMRERSGRIIRPLLSAEPQELRAYLTGIGQPWREDETNRDVTYARNRIRHQVLPALEAAYPGAVRALCRLACAAQRDERHFAGALAALPVQAEPLLNGVALSRRALRALDEALLSRLLAAQMEHAGLGTPDAQAVAAVMRALQADACTTISLPHGGQAVLGKRTLCLIRPQVRSEDTPLLPEGETMTPFGAFTVRPAQPGETGDGIRSQVMPARLVDGACVTQRCKGDAMIPFGRQTPVKLKKLMIDAGVERALRDSLPVIRRGDTILWTVLLRPSAHCELQGGEPGLLVTYTGAQAHPMLTDTIKYHQGDQ